jgi:hypothetical protein
MVTEQKIITVKCFHFPLNFNFPEIRSYAFNHKSEIISILLWGKIAGQWAFLFPLINDLPIAQ